MYFLGTTIAQVATTRGKSGTTNFYDILLELYNSLGLTMILLLFILGGVFILLYKMIEVFIIKFAEGRFNFSFKKGKTNLSNHIALDKLDSIINYQIDSIHIPCSVRSKIFKRILTLRFETIKELLVEMSKKDWDMGRDSLKIVWDNFFANLETTWDRKADQANVPKIIISKFYTLRKETSKVLRDVVSNNCLRSGRDIQESVSIIFDTIVTIESSSLFTIADTLNTLNGEISNITFEGQNCEKCPSIEECNNREGQ